MYFDHVKASRLEWLADLKILKFWDQRKNIWFLNEGAELLFKNNFISEKWLKDVYPSIFYNCYKKFLSKGLLYWKNLSDYNKRELLNELLDEFIMLSNFSKIIRKFQQVSLLSL